MFDLRDRFKANIFVYCDENIGRKVLFKSFTCLWPGNPSGKGSDIGSRDLVELTRNILRDLKEESVVRVIDNSEGHYTGYPKYEILPHKELISPTMRKVYGTFSL